ncbi:MAG: hypothetical protein JWP43_2862 [Ramlibacter sp.]|jgi:hypothetical protein|nr:hypothetical protein [Ramlibacter sp.]
MRKLLAFCAYVAALLLAPAATAHDRRVSRLSTAH